MRVRKKNAGGSVKEMNGCDRIGGNSEAEERFYEKLKKLNESSGLSLLFNFRQTSLGLYKFYEQVTERGGYHQVTKENKWSIVASSMNPEGSLLSPHQLQKIYENLLYPFEQIHHYRTSKEIPVKLHSTPDNTLSSGDCLSCLRRKRKRKRNPNKSNKSSTGHRSINEKSTTEDIHVELEAPVRARTAYQLFVKKECERLREINGDSSESTTSRAIKAWRELPAEKRKPFIEESKKEKDRFNQEMKNYIVEKTTPIPKPKSNSYSDEKTTPVPEPRNYPSPKDKEKTVVTQSKMMWPITDGDYHVTLQPAPESFDLPNESDIELATQLMKNKSVSDTVFQINLEEYWSIDFTG